MRVNEDKMMGAEVSDEGRWDEDVLRQRPSKKVMEWYGIGWYGYEKQGRVRQATVQETREQRRRRKLMERKEEGNSTRRTTVPPFIDGRDPPRLRGLPTIEEDWQSHHRPRFEEDDERRAAEQEGGGGFAPRPRPRPRSFPRTPDLPLPLSPIAPTRPALRPIAAVSRSSSPTPSARVPPTMQPVLSLAG
jgi:hypothetical protein